MKILIADDELRLRKVVAMFLKKSGYDVQEASSGEQTLEIMENFHPDIVVLDVVMPGEGGINTCRKIRNDERYKHIPVILLTANVSDKDRLDAVEAGASEYVTKPFSPKDLLDKIKKLVGTESP